MVGTQTPDSSTMCPSATRRDTTTITHDYSLTRITWTPKGLRVGTFNTRTCHSAAEADEIALDLKAAGVMVCGMQELRYHLIWSGGALDRRKERGVGVLLHPEVAKALTGYYGVERTA